MNAIRNLIQSFARLSNREKSLIVGMGVLFLGLVLFFVAMAVQSSLEDLEIEVDDTRNAIRDIRQLEDDYLDKASRKKKIDSLIEENAGTSLRISLNNIAKRTTIESEKPGYKNAGKKLSDVMEFEGKEAETRIESKSKDKKKKKKDASGHWEISQQISFDDIPVETLYRFLDDLNNTDELVFIRRLNAKRRFDDLKHVKVDLSVATVVYREAGEEE